VRYSKIYCLGRGVKGMMHLLKNFVKEEDGLGTVEIVVIIAVLVGIALIFRKAIFGFVTETIARIFETGSESTSQKDFTSYTAPTMKP
jgi:Flp pilus assembly pilin Flp